MRTQKPITLTPATRRSLLGYVGHTPIIATETCGLRFPAIRSVPKTVVTAVLPWLGPSGLGPNRHLVGNVPCQVHQPAFGAQVVLAYEALTGVTHGASSRDDLNSYGLKHAVTNVWREAGAAGSPYISNGALILAALAHGYLCTQCSYPDNINVKVRLGKGWREDMRSRIDALAALDGTKL